MQYVLSVCLGFFACTFAVTAQTSTEMARADSLFENYHDEEALKAYNEILGEEPENFKALWRSSLLYSRLGNNFDDDNKKKDYYNKANERAERALDVDPLHTQSNFVKAVAMGRMALVAGARERVAASRDIKKYAERSLEADSSNAGAWHVLGRWNYEVSNLSFAERLAANVLFGGIPDGASTEKGARYIEKAIELNPDMLLYYYDLAKAHEELGNEEQAIATCEQTLHKPSVAPDDDKIKADCRELIDNLE